MKYNLLDDTFSHHTSVNLPDNSVAGQMSEYVEWDRTLSDKKKPTFYSHHRMLDVCTPKNLSYGWLFESQSIQPKIYGDIENMLGRFNLVFTHSSKLLNNYNNTRWIPGGGVWVGGTYGKGTIGVKPKSKLCSAVSSNKSMCPLHNFRTEIVRGLSTNPDVECFVGRWVPIYETLDDFMFSIIVENFVDDLYFTEKILNCFATGTIPIYMGATKIGTKFNGDGILTFNTLDELDVLIKTLSPELYNKKIDSVVDNFGRVMNYRTIEDYISINYLKNYEN